MSEEQELKEYRQGETVRLTVEMWDTNGVHYALAAAFLLLDGGHDEKRPAHRLELTGWPEEEPTQAEIILGPVRKTDLVHLQPAVVTHCTPRLANADLR